MTTNEPKISAHFWFRRLHSLSGVVPIGAFLLEHMLSNALILKGPEAYNNQIAFLSNLPFVTFLEIFLIFIPILYHALYGFYVLFAGKSNLVWYPYPANILYSLQRWTGMITFVYIAFHVYETKIVHVLYGTEISFARMQHLMSDPKLFWFYIVGVTAAMFHFANGIWGFLISWGITIGPKSQKIAGALCALFGLGLWIIGIQALVRLVA